MPTLTLIVDERTDAQLAQISAGEGVSVSEMAARLLRRALRAKRPRPVWDQAAIRAHAMEFAEEDEQLADSDSPHHAALLDAEDAAPAS